LPWHNRQRLPHFPAESYDAAVGDLAGSAAIPPRFGREIITFAGNDLVSR
jgi:hypothetical protein